MAKVQEDKETKEETRQCYACWENKNEWESCWNCAWFQPLAKAPINDPNADPILPYGFCRAGHPFPVNLNAETKTGSDSGWIKTESDTLHHDTGFGLSFRYWCRYWVRTTRKLPPYQEGGNGGPGGNGR